MDFRVLGPLEVEDEGRTVGLGGARQRALLSILILHRGEVVTAERLIDDLYGANPPETAANSLHAHVSRLRKAIGGEERLRRRAGGYVLELGSAEVDADRFAVLAAAGREALAADEPYIAAQRFEEALGLWRGPPFVDTTYETFAQTEIARLEELRLATMEELGDARLTLGQHAELVGELRRLTREHPLRERLRAQLMLALYRDGRQADALDVFQDARRRLVDELGIEPGRALRELERAILEQDPALDLVPAGTPPITAPAPPEPGAVSAEDPTAAVREGRRTVTAMFVGVGASSPSGAPVDPELLRRLTARALAEVQASVELHGGIVDTLTADGGWAVFGLPVVHEDDALRAVRAAETVRDRLGPSAGAVDPGRVADLEVRIAVSTGEVVTGGALGVHLPATGEPLTRSSHIAHAASPGEILLDDSTGRLVRDAAHIEPVAGRIDVVRLVEVIEAFPGRSRRFDSPMVGREGELRRLFDTFELAVSRRSCQLFTILGAAGVGKSRLVHEFLRGIEGRATVAQGRCLPYGEGITFWPILEAVKDVAQLDETEPSELLTARLAELLGAEEDAELLARGVLEAIGLSEAVAGRDESFSAVRRLFEALAATRPLVVVFDDVHWGEPTFLDFAEHLAEGSREQPILLLCLARPELFDTRSTWGGGMVNATSALLEPLTDAECGVLIANLLGQAELPVEARARITEASEGNPLFVEEMLSMLIDDGLVQQVDGVWVTQGDLGSIPVPATIHALLAARLDRLEVAERAVIECASVEGKVFHESWVTDVAGGDTRDAVPAHLALLVRKELIRPERPFFAGERAYRFRHLLIRDAAYASISKEARGLLHEQHATWLEPKVDQTRELDEIVGYHLEQAFRYRDELGPLDAATRALGRRAAELIGTAGRRAFLRSDAPAGANLISRAVALLPAEDPLRVELVPNVRVVQGLTDLSWADRVLTEAVEAAAAMGDRRLALHALVQRGFLRLFVDADVTPRELFDVSERAISGFEELGDQLGLARAWRLSAQAHYLDRRASSCADASEQALVHARRSDDAFERQEILEWLTIALLLGPAPVTVARARCSELTAEFSADPQLHAALLAVLALLAAMERDLDEASALMERSRAIMAETGSWAWIASFWVGFISIWRGEPFEADPLLPAAYESLKRSGAKSHFSSIAHQLATIAYAQGRYGDAERLAAECEQACRPNDVHSHAAWRSVRAKVLARRGEHEAAELLVREAVAHALHSDFLVAQADALSDRAEVLVLAGRVSEAAAALDDAIDIHTRKGNVLMADTLRRRRASLA